MQELLNLKLEHCTAFRETLLSAQGNILVKATKSQKWACGPEPEVDRITDPEYRPGQNLLGAMLVDLKEEHLSHRPRSRRRALGKGRQ